MKIRISLKKIVLKKTNGGLLFYQMVIPDLKVNGNRCKNTKNPFYDDINASLSIFKSDELDLWLFKDFGDSDYQGDVFQFAALFYRLDCKKDFELILRKMLRQIYKAPIRSIPVKTQDKKKKPYELYRRQNDRWLKHEIEYFSQYGITQETLNMFKVVPIDGFKGNGYEVKRKKGKVMVAFLKEGYAKIYRPAPKGFWYVGGKSEYIFGIEQLKEVAEGEVVFITGGEKDVMTLKGLGYDAITFNSETAIPSADTINSLVELGYTPWLLYDNDETGTKASAKIAEKFNIPNLILPQEFKGERVKDISDFRKAGLSIHDFRKMIEIRNKNAIKSLKSVNPVVPPSGAKSRISNIFPEEIYNDLPDLLKQTCNLFTTEQERDIVLLGVLAVLSILMPNIKGKYDKKKIYPPLFIFVVAPASSGKGVLAFPKMLGRAIHQFLRDEGKFLFVPANSSATAVLKAIFKNEGRGIIYETEADTLSLTMGNDWGNYSDSLRKAFHHESISLMRVSEDETIEIDEPHISVLLSGTPNQVKSLISSTEDGLFSRFCFYDFNSDNQWRTISAGDSNIDIEEEMNSLSEKVLQHYEKLRSLGTKLIFKFTEEQWAQFNSTFAQWNKEYLELIGTDMIASIRRLGVVEYRIAMILSSLRLMEKWDEEQTELICNDSDFKTSLKIVECLRMHAVEIYNRLQQQPKHSNNDQVKFLNALPTDFSTSDYREIARELNINERTAEGYIGRFFKDGLIFRIKQGIYSKNKPE